MKLQKELIFGIDCVRLALSNSRRKIYRLLAYRNNKVKQNDSHIIQLANDRKIPIQYTSKFELDNLLANRPHQVKFDSLFQLFHIYPFIIYLLI